MDLPPAHGPIGKGQVVTGLLQLGLQLLPRRGHVDQSDQIVAVPLAAKAVGILRQPGVAA